MGSQWISNEKGAVLIISILVLAAVSAIGVIATRSATTELRMAAHDKAHKMTWYFTDAITSEMAGILIERNHEERGFGDPADTLPITLTGASPNLKIYTRDFYNNLENPTCANNIPSATNRDVEMSPSASLAGGTGVYLRIWAETRKTEGAGLEMVEGYSGRAKSAAHGGITKEYTIRGLGLGPLNSQARVTAKYRVIP